MSTESKNQFEGNADAEQADANYTEETVEASEATGTVETENADLSGLELKELRQQSEENFQRSLRTQADFDNFRRRTRQEKEEFAKYASLKVIEQLLPVIDNLERALAAGKEGNDYEALLKGVEMIYRQLEQTLGSEGLKPMDTIGKPFNPEFHQAIMQVESEEYEEGIVVSEIQKGYLLKDRVLRPAMVQVSS
ncbi:nucleotide exchange factor GrpE [Paenibacillus agricola]|uniref:Protein GrpE n=1 Tax=Paenibacillus agricola TaxID=2716264 RepID=A0ABX0J7W5_9BACL|nr:nucleotide exchange factor GrpE [Paenibacillus agricola]NHN30957.1 nucleotide exchange factor GrpE [Paenibacillus agricola]